MPGSGALQKKADRSRDMLELLGPTGDLAQRAIRAGAVTTLSTPTVGGDRALSVASSVGTSSFDAEVATCDGGNFAGVDTAVVRWIARVAD